MVARLRQNVYGLKQAARVWYLTVIAFLKKLGFRVSPFDAGLLIHQQRCIYVTLHVDDSRITCPDLAQIDWTCDQISRRFDINDVTSTHKYLGIHLSHDTSGNLLLHQPAYAESILHDFGMENSRSVHTPLPTGTNRAHGNTDGPDFGVEGDSGDGSFSDKTYREAIGKLAKKAVVAISGSSKYSMIYDSTR